MVTVTNKDKKIEVIDGRQRLTTILLLLKVIYAKDGSMQDEQTRSTRENSEKIYRILKRLFLKNTKVFKMIMKKKNLFMMI